MTRTKPSIRAEIADLLTWVRGARCKSYNPALFEIPNKDRDGKFADADVRRMERAKEICAECPVMMQCLEHAVTYKCSGAIYGGLDDDERAEWADRQPVAV